LHDALLSPLACWMIGEDIEEHGQLEQDAESKKDRQKKLGL
jgi:hypothetical protein